MIVGERDKLNRVLTLLRTALPRPIKIDERVPDVCCTVVLRSAEDTDIDEPPTTGQFPLPVDSRVRSENQIGLGLVCQPVEKVSTRGRFPEELVGLPGTSVAKQHTRAVHLEADLRWQLPHPVTVCLTRIFVRVLITDLSELVVARIGVAALTVLKVIADAVVVVSLDARDVVLIEQGEDAIRVRPEGSQIAQAVQPLGTARGRVSNRRFEGEVVVVDAAKESDFHNPVPSLFSDVELGSGGFFDRFESSIQQLPRD